jgi:hypothetical protein
MGVTLQLSGKVLGHFGLSLGGIDLATGTRQSLWLAIGALGKKTGSRGGGKKVWGAQPPAHQHDFKMGLLLVNANGRVFESTE